VVALEGLALVAHGGIYGAFAEAALALGLAAFFVWIWLRERRKARARGDGPAEMNEDAPDQRGDW
jgi:hypothetical protein